jgi:hypothetical protein
MRSTVARISSGRGVSRASNRRQIWPLVTTAASGWLTSWEIEAVSSPRVITRPTCASSACAFCNASSARCRSNREATDAKARMINVMSAPLAPDGFDRDLRLLGPRESSNSLHPASQSAVSGILRRSQFGPETNESADSPANRIVCRNPGTRQPRNARRLSGHFSHLPRGYSSRLLNRSRRFHD